MSHHPAHPPCVHRIQRVIRRVDGSQVRACQTCGATLRTTRLADVSIRVDAVVDHANRRDVPASSNGEAPSADRDVNATDTHF